MGGISLQTSEKPEGTTVTSLPGEREYLTIFCYSAEVSDGGRTLLLVKSTQILCKHMITHTHGVWCLWTLLGDKNLLIISVLQLYPFFCLDFALRQNERTR